ncbi:protein LEAD-SENSITIVE 1-like [Wolffia australiana]
MEKAEKEWGRIRAGRRARKRKRMGVLSNKVDRLELKPGDHIYSWRSGYVYAHHGIYTGDGEVIHFTRGGGQEMGTGTVLDRLLASSMPPPRAAACESCGDQSAAEGVVASCLDCFLAGGDLYLFLYAASPALFLAKVRGGTCTLAAADPAEEVLHRARFLLARGFGAYDLFRNNCEDFAMYCKTGLLVTTGYGVGRSGQWGCVVSAASAVAGSPLRFLTTGAAGLSLITGGIYCLNRVVSDIGVRRDVVKLPVEDLVSTHLRPRQIPAVIN